MELEYTLPHKQVFVTCPYPKPGRSKPQTHIPLPDDPSYYYYSFYALVSEVVFFSQVSNQNPVQISSIPPYALHSQAISFISIFQPSNVGWGLHIINTLWTLDENFRLCITTVEDGWRTSVFLTRAWFPRTIHFNYAIHAAFVRMVLLTYVYGNVTQLRSNDLW